MSSSQGWSPVVKGQALKQSFFGCGCGCGGLELEGLLPQGPGALVTLAALALLLLRSRCPLAGPAAPSS
jgi:hypothetical protein